MLLFSYQDIPNCVPELRDLTLHFFSSAFAPCEACLDLASLSTGTNSCVCFFSNQESFFRRSNYRLLHAQQVLGALAMIDDGELDWKILAISMDDPMASELLGPSKREDFGT